jgi:hypothetical protein
MGRHTKRLIRGVSHNGARTSAEAGDPRLRGRTYDVPFEQVWQAAVKLASGGLRGWSLLHKDDQEGVIRAEARPLALRTVADVMITIVLDEDAQTRVDMQSTSRKGFADLGSNGRRIARFFKALDRALAKVTARKQLEVEPGSIDAG